MPKKIKNKTKKHKKPIKINPVLAVIYMLNFILAFSILYGYLYVIPTQEDSTTFTFTILYISMAYIFGITAPQTCSKCKNIFAEYLQGATIVTTALIAFYFFTIAAFFRATITIL